jgi:hypothetical protein
MWNPRRFHVRVQLHTDDMMNNKSDFIYLFTRLQEKVCPQSLNWHLQHLNVHVRRQKGSETVEQWDRMLRKALYSEESDREKSLKICQMAEMIVVMTHQTCRSNERHSGSHGQSLFLR